MSQNSSLEQLTQAVLSFVRAESWQESKTYLAEHPELLTDDAFEGLEPPGPPIY